LDACDVGQALQRDRRAARAPAGAATRRSRSKLFIGFALNDHAQVREGDAVRVAHPLYRGSDHNCA
jgi:hypothetical protein